jgi:hypothetical protein
MRSPFWPCPRSCSICAVCVIECAVRIESVQQVSETIKYRPVDIGRLLSSITHRVRGVMAMRERILQGKSSKHQISNGDNAETAMHTKAEVIEKF